MPKYDMVTDEQIMDSIPTEFVSEWKSKFARGKIEHGGNIIDKRMLPNAIDEALDLVSYLYVLRYQVQKLQELSREATTEGDLMELQDFIKDML